jgi:glucan phosphoethanolaminetransferase (alkaline phosphatase superfamily)
MLKLDIKTAIILLLVILFSLFLTIGLDLHFRKIVFTIIFLLLVRKSRFLSIITFIALIIPICYTSVSLEFGRLNVGYIGSLFETNLAESKEFLYMLPTKNYLFVIMLFMLLSSALFLWRKPLTFNKNYTNKKTLFCKMVFFAVVILMFFGTQICEFYKEFTSSYREYLKEYQKLSQPLKSNFILRQMKNFNDKDVRIVIIGESLRKDYLHVYGYHYQTTPFLDNANGIFIDGYVSASGNTIASLTRTLCVNNNGTKIDCANNVINLANSAGYETFWISNQGFMGKWDTSTTQIAKVSNHITFLNRSDWSDKSDNWMKDDFDILPELEKALDVKTDKHKIIFLHTMGSHPNPCERLHGYPVNFESSYGKDFDCYLASVEKTDLFISKIAQTLQDKNLSYSIIYFSDHGLRYKKTAINSKEEVIFRQGNDFKQNYEVPFFMLDSDINQHIVIKKGLSALNFIDIFASWIGYRTDKTDDSYSIEKFPENKRIKVFNLSAQKNVDFETLPEQNAIY